MKDLKAKESQCMVSTSLNKKEKERFTAIAGKIDIPYCRIVRQLIRYLLRGRIGWLELFEMTNDCGMEVVKGKTAIRTSLPLEMCAAFSKFVEEKGSTPSVVLRRLILLYITGKIEWAAIWFPEGEGGAK